MQDYFPGDKPESYHTEEELKKEFHKNPDGLSDEELAKRGHEHIMKNMVIGPEDEDDLTISKGDDEDE